MKVLKNIGRRKFLQLLQYASVAAWSTTLPKIAVGKTPELQILPPIPPGAGSLKEFRNSCTACQLCVSQCPSSVLQPAIFENGLTGFMQPVLKYGVHHFCEYDCRKCIEICPTRALGDISITEKKLTRIGEVNLVLDKCIVIKNDKSCGACAEHCPTGALRMVPHKPGLTKPEIVNKDACIGCGGCESICPEPKLALYINRLAVHEVASKPKIVEKNKAKFEDFGF